MKVALISPREYERSKRFYFLHRVYRKLEKIVKFTWDDIEFSPNLGLLTIAAFIPRDWEIEYIDEDYITDMDEYDSILDKDFDLVCMTAVCTQVVRAYYLCDEFRKKGAVVCMGGWHASTIPEEVEPHVDSIIIGEGEDTFPVFLEDFKKGKVKKRYVSAGNFDLTKSPIPRYDLIKHIEFFNEIPVNITRGCPFKCSFCTVIDVYGNRYRHKTIEQVHKELDTIKSLIKRPRIIFADENMLVNRKFSKELLKSFIGAGIRYETFADISIAEDEELLELLYESGCHTAFVGLESTRPDTLKKLSPFKLSKLDNYEDAIEIIQSHGIKVIGSFIAGIDGDDYGIFKEIRDFGLKTNLYETGILVLTPVPGTKIWDDYKEQGRLLDGYTNLVAMEFINYKPLGMTPMEIEKGMIWVHKELNNPKIANQRRAYFKKVWRNLLNKKGGFIK